MLKQVLVSCLPSHRTRSGERQAHPLTKYSVAKFYINIDNLNNVAQSAMQASTIKNYIENAEKVMLDIDTQLNSCQGNWDTTQPPVDKQKVKDAIKVASDYLATVNTKFKGH